MLTGQWPVPYERKELVQKLSTSDDAGLQDIGNKELDELKQGRPVKG